MAAMNPSPTKPVVRYPTALLEDKELVTIHDSRLPDYKALEYGAPYPDQNKFPGLKLIFQEPLEDDRMVRRVWAGDRKDQDLYNADRKYSGGSTEHPILVRRYLFPEDGYEPLATGTPDSQFPEAVLVEEEVTQPENRNGYLAVTRVFETLPGPLLTGVQITEKGQIATITTQVVEPGTTVTPSAKIVAASVKPDSKGKSVLEKVEVQTVFGEQRFTAEKPEVVPTQFRAAVPEETTEAVVEGTAEMPELGDGDKAASQEQVTVHKKRVRRTSRDLSNVSETLVETNIDEAGIVETITKTLKTGSQTVNPTATLRGQVEELGDNLTLKTEVQKGEVFPGKVFAAERPDPVPEKFRVAVPTKTVEETAVGTAGEPTLVEGEIAESEQQVTKFTKRTRRVSRDTADLPKTLTQTTTTNEGLKATVTEVLQVGDTVEIPSATKSVESEAMGDGTFVVRTTNLPEVFSGKTLAVENPDPVPAKFRTLSPSTTEEETVAGTVQPQFLASGEIAKSEQQITKHTKRKRKVTRARADLPVKLKQIGTGTERRKKYIEETLQLGDTTRDTSPTVSVQSEALGDGTYLVRTEDDVEIFTGAAYSVETPDSTPQKFRSRLPMRTEERNQVGVAARPELSPGDIAQSNQQIDKFNVRRRKTYRAIETLPVTLAQTDTNAQGQKVTVTETLQHGDTAEQPSATLAVQSESLGDGKYVVRRTQLPEVFPEKTVSLERPDTAPQKFRAALPTTTMEETVAGQIGGVALGAGELAASEQQVTKHTKRTRRVSRNAATLPQTLVQTDTNDKGQRVTVSETYQQGNTAELPTATSQIQSEAMGDGTYVVRKSTVTRVFDGKQIQISIPEETMPERFRAAIPTEVLEETVTGNVAASLSLTGSEISKSEQQLTEHTKRTRSVARRATTSTPTLKGQNYDATLNVVYPYEEKITNSGASLGRPNTEVSPISGTQDLVREFDPKAIGEALSKINLTFPSRASLSLPPVLKKIEVVWDVVQEAGNYQGSGTGAGRGDTWAWDVKGQGEARAVAGVTPGWVVDMEEIWASGVPTTSHIFFLPYPVTAQNILSKLNVLKWPVFRPKSHSLVAFGKKITATENASSSAGQSRSGSGSSASNSSGRGVSYGASTSAATVRIPPCLHANVTVTSNGTAKARAVAAVNVGERFEGFGEDGSIITKPIVSIGAGASALAQSTVNLPLGATSPTDIPRSGRYLVDSRVEPYQYGFARVYAEVLDASVFA